MRASYIVRVDATYADMFVSGAICLGIADGDAIMHVAPSIPPRRLLNARLVNGAITYDRELAEGEVAPDGVTVMVVGERSPLPWGEDAAVVYDPTPALFLWEAFVLAHPEYADLTPHQWAGE